MQLSHWLGSIVDRRRERNSRLSRTALRRSSAYRSGSSSGIESLEDRVLLTTFNVNTVVDTVDANPGDGVSADAGGNSSLRAAIMESNALPGSDTIQLGVGVFGLTQNGLNEDAAATGDLDVTGTLLIIGSGTSNTIIDGNFIDRVLHVLPGASLELRDLTVREGQATGNGGGILNEGRVTLTDVVVTQNKASVDGGGVYNADIMSSLNTTVSNNTADGNGGGVYNADMLTVINGAFNDNAASLRGGGLYNTHDSSVASSLTTITDSEFRGNSANSRGGGIFNDDQLQIDSSTLDSNTAGSRGGAIYNQDMLTANNSTISRNEASSRGGGIFNAGDLTLFQSTVSTNSTLPGTSTSTKSGGGIYNSNTIAVLHSTIANNAAEEGGGLFHLGASATAYNTIIGTNTATTANPDTVGTFTTLGNNLIGDVGTATGFTPGSNGDLVGGNGNPVINPRLNPLGTSGGVIEVHSLKSNSPAIDTGNNTDAPGTDQIGLTRLIDGDLDTTIIIDIGAVEFQPAPVLIGPIGVITTGTPTFSWSAVQGAQRYDLWVNDLTTGQSQVIRETALSTTSFTPVTPLDLSHRYLWTVRALFPNGIRGNFAKSEEFFGSSATPAPTLVAPLNSTTDTTPTFQWTAVPGAVKYDLWVNNLTTGQSEVIREKDLTTTSFTAPTNLPAGHSYIWTVRGMLADGTPGRWAEHVTFRILTAVAPTLIGPMNQTIDPTPTFEWTAVPDAIAYDLWVNNVTTGETEVIRNTNVPGTMFTPANPLPIGHQFIWTVRSISADGTPGKFAPHKRFTIVTPDAVSPPNLLSPIASTIDATPEFRWEGVQGASRYELVVNNTTTGQNNVIHETNLQGMSFTAPTPLPAGDSFVWTVRAFNELGNATQFAAVETFSIIAPTSAAPPVLMGPSGTTIDSTPTFRWGGVTGAATYDLWVNDLTTGQSQVIRETSLTGMSFTPTVPLTIGNEYLWTVRAINDDGVAGGFATQVRFRVLDPTTAAAPTPVSPSGDTISQRPPFEWTGVNGAARYELEVNNLTTGENQVIHETNLTSMTFMPTTPLNNGDSYEWRVRGFTDNNVAGQFSDFTAFNVTDPASVPAPTLIAPVGSQNNGLVTFSWSAISGAVRYDLWVNNLTTGESQVIRETNLKTNSFTPDAPLTAGHSYIWTVRAINDAGVAGSFAAHRRFNIVGAAAVGRPTLLTPVTTTNDTTPTFVWTAIQNAATYEIWVNNLTTGQSEVIRRSGITSSSYTDVVPLTAGNEYIWTVRAFNSAGQAGDWSVHKRFNIAAAANSTLVAPDDASNSPAEFESNATESSLESPFDDGNLLLAESQSSENDTETEENAIPIDSLATDEALLAMYQDSSSGASESDPPRNESYDQQVADVMTDWSQTDWWAEQSGSKVS